MESMNPTVSIVVRTKDRPFLVERALASVAAQTYRPLEVVAVNDGGTALDEERLRRTLGNVPLRLITLPSSGGRAHAGNVGLAAAAGSFIGFLDDDDELLPRHATTLVTQSVLSGAGVVYSDCETVLRELGPRGEILREESAGRFFLSRDYSPDILLFENHIPLICVLFSRASLAGLGGFDEGLEVFEDWDLYLRVAARFPFHHVPEVTARYVQWSRTSQIAFAGNVDGRDAYLRVLAKNLGRIGPQSILAYYLARQEDLKAAATRQRALRRELAELGTRLDVAENRAAACRDEAEALAARLADREAFVREVTGSASWRLLHLYRTRVKSLLGPAGSLRRQAYDAVLGTIRRRPSAAVEQPPQAPPVVVAPPPPSSPLSPPEPPQPPAPELQPEPPPAAIVRESFEAPARRALEPLPLPAVVSVVIPTLNAGPGLRAVLRRLRDQRGLAEVEIVAIDSGSADETLGLCREFGVAVAAYEGGAFNHGRARTQGVARTRGEYVVFMSQDAYPAGTDAVARMVRYLAADASVAVASGREVPRSDADLFSCWQLWYFNERILGYRGDTAVGLDAHALAALPPAERRKAAQVNNVFCCVRRSVFDQVGLRPLPFAEDLDFGLRVLQAGHRIAFMPTVAVVHSHRRPAAYHLRRLFADWLAQVDLLGFEPLDWSRQGVDSAAAMVSDIASFHRRLGPVLASLDVTGPVGELEQRLRDALFSPADPEGAPSGSTLDTVLRALVDATGGGELPAPSQGRLFRDRYLGLVHELLTFAAAFADLSHRADDVRESLHNLFGHLAGWCLADYVRFSERTGRVDPGLGAVTRVLAGGA
jgi:glycosyltransferase involved in cell wall biosynthesis